MAFDAFLKIDGVPGESTDDKHKNWIEILSYSHGASQPSSGSISGSGRASGRVDLQDFTIIKSLDKTSAKLNVFCCNGKAIKEIKLELCGATGDKTKFMEYVLSDCKVTSISPNGDKDAEAGMPAEEVTFDYAKIKWLYTELDHKTSAPKGDVEAEWDLSENKGG